MKHRTAWPSTLALVLALVQVGLTRCAAQSPVMSAAAPSNLGAGQDGRTASPLPESTVSPAIARFVRQSGRDVGPLPAPGVLPNPMSRTMSRLAAAAEGRTGRLSTAGPSPLSVHVNLKPAPLEPTDFRFPMSFATALRLADARPLIVAAAQASVWVAEAELTRAKLLWIPVLFLGFDFTRHDGGGPDFNKGIMTAPSVNYFMAGAGADGFLNITDAYFEPLAARQVLNSRHWEIQAAKNDALQQTANAYFRVHQYRGLYAGALYTVARGHELVERIRNLSRELVPLDEVDRARNMLADLQQRAVADREQWRVSSADLTQILRLDPRAVVVPLEEDHVQITLIDPGRSLDDLMPIAFTNRPELASNRALVQEAEVRIRQEKMRPLLPIVTLNGFQTPNMFLQAGLFGIGPNSSLNQYRGRFDVSLQLVWQYEAFGLGNLARIKQRRGQESRAIVDFRRAQDTVVADVTRALARVQSTAARVLQADRALRTAIITFNGHLEGLEQTRRLGNFLFLTFRPQEAVYSLEQLNVSFDEYFTTVAEYNRAQFDLFHALGYPAQELAVLRTPGDVRPVDTTRPAFLPPVGNGPPPATR